MKRAFLSRTALLVVMAAVLLTWEAKAQEPPTACQTADVLRQAGFYEEARDKYVELIKSDPGLACARDAFRELPGEQANKLYELGQAYEESSQPDLARDAYVEALRVDPTFDEAWQALEKLGPLRTEDQEPPSSCELAQAPHSKGFYQEARDAYFQLIKSNPELECAQIGIRLLPRDQARHLVELGQRHQEGARDAYVEALKVDPTYDDAWQALEKLSSLEADDTQDTPTVAEVFARHGFNDEAKEKLQEAITNNPDLPELSKLAYQVVWEYSFWEWLVHRLKPVWRPAIVPIAAILFFLWLGLVHWPRFWAWSWFVNWIFPRRLDIPDFDDNAANRSIGPGMAARVEEELNQIMTPEFQRRVHVIEGSAEALPIPAGVKSAVPSSLKIVLELIETVSPRSVITLQGRLQNSEDHGAGLTLTLVQKRSGKITANQTIWQDEYDPKLTTSSTSQAPVTPSASRVIGTASKPGKTATSPPLDVTADAYYLLAQLTASWTLFRLAEQLQDKQHQELIYLLGTGSWRSYACVQAGVHWRLQGKRGEARRMFWLALDEDPRNRGALFNLGTLNVETGKHAESLNQLEKARDLLEKEAKEREKDYRRNRMWYQTTYYLASAYAYMASTDAKNKDINIKTAAAEANKLVDEIKKMIGKPNSVDEVKRYLEWLKPMAILLKLGIEIQQGQVEDIEQYLKREEIEVSELHYRARYNLACYYSATGQICRERADKTESERLKREGKTYAKTYYEESLKHLEHALERGGDIVQWARNDPSLQGVREEDELAPNSQEPWKTFKKAFEEIVEKYA